MNRDFRLFLLAQSVSNFGDWLSLAAMSQLTFVHAGSADVAYLQSVTAVGTILIGPFIGLVVDYRAARRTLIFSSLMLGLVTLGFLFFQFHWYFFLKMVKTLFELAFGAAYGRFFPRLVPEEHLDRASGIVSTMRQVTTTAGVTVGTYLAAYVGTRVFYIDACTFAFAAACLACIPREVAGVRHDGAAGFGALAQKLRADLREGLSHLLHNRDFAAVVLLYALAHICWGVKDVAAWALVTRHFGMLDKWTGTYMAMATAGEFIGGVLIARGLVNTSARVTRKVAAGLCLLSLTFVLAGMTSAPMWGLGIKVLEGVASVMVGVMGWNLLVYRAPEAIRGRVAGFVGMITGAFLLVGKLWAGLLIDRVAPRLVYTFTGGTVLLLTVGLWLALRGSEPATSP